MTIEMKGSTVFSAKRSKPKSHFDDCGNSLAFSPCIHCGL